MRQLICFVILLCVNGSFLFSAPIESEVITKYPCTTSEMDKTSNPLSKESSNLANVLEKIETKMKSIKTLECNFVQEKKLNIMNKPIIIKGKIYIQSPNFFAWHSTQPVRYSLIIKEHILKQWNGDNNQINIINLKDKPMFQVIISQMKSWFSGSYTKQTDDYNIKIVHQNPLMLKFSPKLSSSTSEFVKAVEVSFKNDLSYIANIKILEKNNDSMSMRFSDVILNHTIPSSTWSIKSDI